MSLNLIIRRGTLPLCLLLTFGLSSFTVGTPWKFTVDPSISVAQWKLGDQTTFTTDIDTGYMHSMLGLYDGLLVFNLSEVNLYDLKKNTKIHHDLFETAKYPKCSLVIERGEYYGYRKYKTKGTLSVKGITKPIQFVWKKTPVDTIKKTDEKFTTQFQIENASFGIKSPQPYTTLSISLKGNWFNY